MDSFSPIDSADLSVAELKIISEKAEKALDSCIARGEILENRLEVLYRQLYRVNIVGVFSVIAALILKFNMELAIPIIFTIPVGIFLLGVFSAVITALLGIIIQQPFAGSVWSDFEDYADIYDKNETGLLRYSIDVCLDKIQDMIEVCEYKTKCFIYSLWTVVTTIILSLSASMCILI